MVKQLVCVAPDGSLEVWAHGFYSWAVESIVSWEIKPITVDNVFEDPFRDLVFWGREVLGEL